MLVRERKNKEHQSVAVSANQELMNQPEKKNEASLLQPREGAGKHWWETFLRGHISDINRRFNQAKALYITAPERAPLDLFSFVREAALCFEIGRYLPAIALASASAELIMNRDQRTRSDLNLLRTDRQRVVLCSENLKSAHRLGLPTDLLLSVDETFDGPILFLDRSNKVVRGDVSEWLRGISDYVPTVEQEARDQLEKAQRLVVAWFNTSTDVNRRDQ
jgi:hypothetical protein